MAQAETTSGQETREIRLYQEGFEKTHLHPFAAKSAESKGRDIPETPCPIRTAFQRDRDRILHCKSFRRLKHKTQVFFSPVGDHYRTRLTHSLEVAQVSRTIARALRLNEDLTEAIALAHDMGHPPFGHSGERVLNSLSPDGFHHYQQSVRIAIVIERLNLSWEILDALQHDTGAQKPATMEGQVVTLADRMAYLHHDVEDAVRAGLMHEADLPEEIVQVLGPDRATRLDRMVMDIISVSQDHFDRDEALIGLSPEIEAAMLALRKWMFEHVYLSPSQQKEIDKIERVLQGLFAYYQGHPEEIPEGIPDTGELAERRVIDYIAGMTDRYAIDRYATLLLPAPYIPL